MENNKGLELAAPRIVPVLDPEFRPAVLANRAFKAKVDKAGDGVPVRIALEQKEGNVSRSDTQALVQAHPASAGNFFYLERMIKLLLWSRGGFRIYFDGPASLASRLAAYFRETPTGKFDSTIVAEKMFDHPLEFIHTRDLPAQSGRATPLRRHLHGCRIGFDLGGSDRQVAAL